ncbi:MAG: NYN domain-containing protein [Chloroflexi bacterium]|nr:NYN domain-containing protein [Chloroflexota bacterium]MCC6892514.1 NYN domain-containing protein [Anaerolineae bacterium]
MENQRQLALLIDGENAQAGLLPQILEAVSQYGSVTIRRVYGDWSKSQMTSWREVAHTYALETPHQFHYTKGKNATDIALIIGAMDILYTNEVDGFCIVSSDSDYTPLAIRIRQQNLFVVGIGRTHTSQGFVEACNEFMYTDGLQALVNGSEPVVMVEPKEKVTDTQPVAADNLVPKKANVIGLKKLFKKAFALATTDDGWVSLAAMGTLLRQAEPSFDYHTYGHSHLLKMLEANTMLINIHRVKTEDGKETIYVQLKNA